MVLKTSTYFYGDVTVLRCSGRLVAGEETTAFRGRVENQLSERRRVVLNLTEIDYIDSSGLAVLVRLLTKEKKLKRQVRLVSYKSYLTDLLRRTKLDTVITVYPSEDEAIASLAQQ